MRSLVTVHYVFVLIGEDHSQGSYIRKGKVPSCYYYYSVTLRVPPLDSDMGWTGELWSKTNYLNWQNKENKIKIGKKRISSKFSDFSKTVIFLGFFKIFRLLDNFWHFWNFLFFNWFFWIYFFLFLLIYIDFFWIVYISFDLVFF